MNLRWRCRYELLFTSGGSRVRTYGRPAMRPREDGAIVGICRLTGLSKRHRHFLRCFPKSFEVLEDGFLGSDWRAGRVGLLTSCRGRSHLRSLRGHMCVTVWKDVKPSEEGTRALISLTPLSNHLRSQKTICQAPDAEGENVGRMSGWPPPSRFCFTYVCSLVCSFDFSEGLFKKYSTILQ